MPGMIPVEQDHVKRQLPLAQQMVQRLLAGLHHPRLPSGEPTVI